MPKLTAEKQSSIELVKKAKKLADKKIPDSFFYSFFKNADYESLVQRGPKDLAALAEEAYAFLQTKKNNHHKVRIREHKCLSGSTCGDSLVIDIINDDMPFLVDSVLGLLIDKGCELRLVTNPRYFVSRNGRGQFESILETDQEGYVRESFIHLHIAPLRQKNKIKELSDAIDEVLKDVRLVVDDWAAMKTKLKYSIVNYQTYPPPVPVDELAEVIQFLEWLSKNNFTLLGMREFTFEHDGKTGSLERVRGSGLGLLRDPKVSVLRTGGKLVNLTPEVSEFLMHPAPLIVTKANVKSSVHRRTYMDYVGIKKFDVSGKLIGELRVIGLFTATAYHQEARSIPYLRRKVLKVIENSGLNPDGHSGKVLLNVLENYPRDELFQTPIDVLEETAESLLDLSKRPRVRLFSRIDKFDRFVSSMVFIPKERFNSDVREKIGKLLTDRYEGRLSAFYPTYLEGPLVRVHYVIGRDEGKTPKVNTETIEKEIAALTQTWEDHLMAALEAEHDEETARDLIEQYAEAFSAAYQEHHTPQIALSDIDRIESLIEHEDVQLEFYRSAEESENQIRLRLYHIHTPIALSDRLPILENMGLRVINERSYRIYMGGNSNDQTHTIWIHDIVMESQSGGDISLDRLKEKLEKTYSSIWQKKAENDGYNALCLQAGLTWQQILILRICGKYLRQARIPYSQRYMWSALRKHAGLAKKLVELFEARFALTENKERPRKPQDKIMGEIEKALEHVSSLDEDVIVRRFANLIMSTLRTNYYQLGNHNLPEAVALKIASENIRSLPEPRPFREIFVYAAHVEGVHLRFGKIARGGLRWSDRAEDFRTEVLGLVKAQQVKNAVIVPVGSKGGFYPKFLPVGGTRDEMIAEGVRCYKTFISSLLSVTDNLKGTKVIPPQNVKRHDEDDPYLVVAADKGTATFSDIANEISSNHDFWLDDAFASGGSAGYDHKKMGITARGGWEAVKRHFREMDINIQTTPFSVIGVGDMSGDVFGNGMLLSKYIRLVAAFDHRDIFIDPDPDPASTFKERMRLFKMGRSSWQDYDKSLISKGGGIFSRSEKSIPLSSEIRDITGLKGQTATPLELMKSLLKAEADLLWFGGIGTYVRSKNESDDEVGDHNNDALRITAEEMNFKVVGEGANLGMTQNARIEFAKKGGRVNTDAIDNSAGVNSSDLEVNIKITLGAAEQAGKLKRAARNKFLASMTNDVADLCLQNNYQQTLSISLAEKTSALEMPLYSRFMKALEQTGRLDRALEFLPDDTVINERMEKGLGLTRPELSVLLAYAKLEIYDHVLESDLPDDPYFEKDLKRYFPAKLQEKYSKEISSHKLRRDIISTVITNDIVNRCGPSFVSRMVEEERVEFVDVVLAYVKARECFGLQKIFAKIDALDNKVASDVQLSLYHDLSSLLRRQTIWFLREDRKSKSLDQSIALYGAGLVKLWKVLDAVLPQRASDRVKERKGNLSEQQTGAELASIMAHTLYLQRAPDIIKTAEISGKPVENVSRLFYHLGAELKIDMLLTASAQFQPEDYYEQVAFGRLVMQLTSSHRDLVNVLLKKKITTPEQAKEWTAKTDGRFDELQKVINDIVKDEELSVSKLAVVTSLLRDLAS